MDDNIEKNEPQAEKEGETESFFEEVFNGEADTQESVTDDSEVFEDKPIPQLPIALTPVEPIPQNISRRGFKAFIIALCALVILSGALAGGYLLGKSSSDTGKRSKGTNIQLNAKPQKGAMSMNELYEKCVNSIVGISVYNDTNASSGSGVIFSKDGYIITCDHIYEEIPSAKFYVYTNDGVAHPAAFVAGDARSDIAVLRITDGGKYTPATFGDSNELYIGEEVCAIGCPISADITPSITKGNISLLNRRLNVTSNYASKYIQTNTAFNPGSSGGALFNMFGQVVGITSAKISGNDYEGLFFAVPTATVKDVAESLIKNGCVKGRAKMGVSYSEISAPAADAANSQTGLYVSEIADTSDAKGKLNAGDIITKVNGKDITSDDVLLDVIEAAKPGDSVTLTVVDSNNNERTVDVKLIEDIGASSYTVNKKSVTPKSDEKNDSSDSNGTFNFPFGE